VEAEEVILTKEKKGALGKFVHSREPTPIDKQDVIRMNRGTRYSTRCSTSTPSR
jgi:hypothetical protein